jgi:hypothetical protein
VFDQHQNFLKAIRTKKARNIVIDSILSRPLGPGARLNRRYRQNLAEEKLHNEEVIADLEAQDARLLLRKVAGNKALSHKAETEFAVQPVVEKNTEPERSPDAGRERIQLGRWAAQRVEELRKVNRFSLGKSLSEPAIREEFPDLPLWREVVDRFYPQLKKKFFEEVSRRRWKQPELFALLGEVWEISEATLYDDYKAYRAASGMGRNRKPPKPKTSDRKTA